VSVTATITIDDTAVVRALSQIADQAPFAMSIALNRIANAGQADVRSRVKQAFTLRRESFILRTIYRKPGEDFADRGSRSRGRPTLLEAAVRIHEDRNQLAKHEEGGIQRSTSGARLAIPAMVGRNKFDIIPRNRRPRALRASPRVRVVGDQILETVGRGRVAATRLLYVLTPQVRLQPRLRMLETIEQVVAARWEPEIMDAIARAVATAR
jgi:hypothetical protein